MDVESWRELLTRWNAELLETPDMVERLPEEVVASGWLGFPGATEEQIAPAETRLGMTLPRSYRSFLQVSNGWRRLGHFHWNLWSVEQVEWFRVRNQDWIDAYHYPYRNTGPPVIPDDEYFVYGRMQNEGLFRTEYMSSLLEISGTGDSTILLLNPRVIFPNGSGSLRRTGESVRRG